LSVSKERIAGLDFDIIKEPWNKYSLRDGSSLKCRYALHRILKREILKPDGSVEGKPQFAIEGQQMNAIIHTLQELRGPPATEKYSPEELQAAIVAEEIPYDTIAEEWNEYVAEEGTRVRVKQTVTKVSRTNKFDKAGFPVYIIESSALAEVKPPKT